ncbi:MAG: glutamine hydrolyzing CTP synthase [Thermoplasmata archaeon]
MKYIFVTGGVLSGLGKGITVSSIAKLLKCSGLKVTAIKIDPYLNCDAGTMNPYQHGEVFVLEDGGEVDLDLGNYERFLDENLTSDHNITTGKVYRAVIEKERKGEYLGKTVQIIPHITNEIKERIKKVSEATGAEVVIVEIGGTVGDIESMPFLEAARQMRRELGSETNSVFVHTTLVPVLSTVGEQKTKPTQHSVKELREIGIQPDVIVARSSAPLDYEIKKKISLFCDVPLEAVVSAPDTDCIYKVPLILHEQKLTSYLLRKLGYGERETELTKWKEIVKKLDEPTMEVNIAIVGKYTHLKDAYLSYTEAIRHCEAEMGMRVNKLWVEAETLENSSDTINMLRKVDGILVPGGFGERGIEGKIRAIQFAREHKIPFLGVCLGFQLAVVEFTRNVLGYPDANSTEFNPATKHPVIDLLPEQKNITEKGATMRLGAHKIHLRPESTIAKLYNSTVIYERHRHRYEVNPQFINAIEKQGMVFTGKSEDERRCEVLELPIHPFFLGTQFHAEFKSRPGKPSPPYLGFIQACGRHRLENLRDV